ncbi:hypothetical protein ACU686_23225 [Yinghuangia aomiensis]
MDAGAVRRGAAGWCRCPPQGLRTRPDADAHAVAYEQAVRASGLALDEDCSGPRRLRQQRVPVGRRGASGADGRPRRSGMMAAADRQPPGRSRRGGRRCCRGDGHAGQVHELTGGEAPTPRQRAQVLADVLGEPVRYAKSNAVPRRSRRAARPVHAAAGARGDPHPRCPDRPRTHPGRTWPGSSAARRARRRRSRWRLPHRRRGAIPARRISPGRGGLSPSRLAGPRVRLV